jgi:hypothetical protein
MSWYLLTDCGVITDTSDFKIPKPGKLPEALRPVVKYDFHKLDLETEAASDLCVSSIHFDIMSDRKDQQGAGAMKVEWGSVGMAVMAINDTDPSQVERLADIVAGFEVIVSTLDGERQFYEHHGIQAVAACLGCGLTHFY